MKSQITEWRDITNSLAMGFETMMHQLKACRGASGWDTLKRAKQMLRRKSP